MDAMSSAFFEKEIERLEHYKMKSTAIVPSSSAASFLETMKKQLGRKDKTLIKADIVAILIHLKPELLERVQDLDKYTVTQLNAMVRSTIYDVRRIDALLTENFLSHDSINAICHQKASKEELVPRHLCQDGRGQVVRNDPEKSQGASQADVHDECAKDGALRRT